MAKDRVDIDELNHDLYGYRSNVITEAEVNPYHDDPMEQAELHYRIQCLNAHHAREWGNEN